MVANPKVEALGRGLESGDDYRLIGTAFRRVDGRAKVTGQTQFADDLNFPRMAYVKLVRSTVPHARIRNIDLSAALAMDGVLGTLVGTELPDKFGILPVSEDEHALAVDTVRFVGDPVAAVAAVSEDIAHEAALAVKVEYELLPTISSFDEALRTPEPKMHDYADDGNIHKKVSLKFGDVEEGFEEADVILEDTCYFEGNTHLAMEQHSAVGVPEDTGRVTVYSSTQTPHYVHRALTRVLGLPASRIRVVACSNGGGFGGKSDPFNHEMVVAKLALKLGRPCKVTLTREEVFYCHRGRHPVLMHLKTGFRKDGSITSQHLRTALDGGAFGSYGVASTYYTGALQTTTYRIPNYWFEGARAFTNKPPCGPKRGHGTPQPRFAFEVHLDKAAHHLGIDPAELRLRNLQPPDSVTANWLRIGSIELGECIEAVVRGSGWKERYGKLPEGRGLGLACGAYLCGAGLPIYWNHMPQSGVQIKLDRSGCVAVFCGETEIGQGSDSVLAAIVAEVLGIELEDIRLCVGDTDLTPVDLGSYSSRVTMMVGHAAMQAAERARVTIAKAVAAQLEVSETELVFADPARLSRRRSGRRTRFQCGRGGGRGPLRHPRHHRFLYTATRTGTLPRRRRGAIAYLFLLRCRGRGGSGSANRRLRLQARLDGARYRPGHQSGARPGPDRGQHLHGPRRGDDGGTGVPAPAQAPVLGAGPQDALAAGVQEPRLPRYAGDDQLHDRIQGRARAHGRQGSRPGPAAADHAGGGQRHLRCGWRARRPGAGDSGTGPEGAGSQGQGAAGSSRSYPVSQCGLWHTGGSADPGAGRRRPCETRIPNTADCDPPPAP